MEKKRGRPTKKIDKEQFEKLCVMQCTLNEIAGWFNCSEDTIENWCKKEYGELFSDVLKSKSVKGKISLRRSQFQAAEAGNTTMLIWLGKQYLGQKEPKQEVAVTNADDDSIKEMQAFFEEKKKSRV